MRIPCPLSLKLRFQGGSQRRLGKSANLSPSKKRIKALECAPVWPGKQWVPGVFSVWFPPSLEGPAVWVSASLSVSFSSVDSSSTEINRKEINKMQTWHFTLAGLDSLPSIPKTLQCFFYKSPLGNIKASSVFAALPFSLALQWSCLSFIQGRWLFQNLGILCPGFSGPLCTIHCVLVPLSFCISPTEDCLWQ